MLSTVFANGNGCHCERSLRSNLIRGKQDISRLHPRDTTESDRPQHGTYVELKNFDHHS